MKYRCLWCGAVFEEPRRVPDGLFMSNTMVSEECTVCGSEDFEEIDDTEEEE